MEYRKKHKFRKERFALDDNFKLDKIRDSTTKKGEQKSSLNVWLSIVISLGILFIAFIIPAVANFTINRRHNDALSWADDTVMLLRKATMDTAGASISNGTIFLVERYDKYYLFWYDSKSSARGNLVEINDIQGSNMPVNIKQGEKVEYPFRTCPFSVVNDEVELVDWLQVEQDYKVSHFDNDEFNREKRNAVDVYVVERQGEN